jgi:hypothetical protein
METWFELGLATPARRTLVGVLIALCTLLAVGAQGASGASLPGWRLTSTNTDLAPHGFNCSSLQRYEGPEKPAAGTTISQQRIAVPLDLSAGGITIAKSCVQPSFVYPGMSVLGTTDFNRCDDAGCATPPSMGRHPRFGDRRVAGRRGIDLPRMCVQGRRAGGAYLHRRRRQRHLLRQHRPDPERRRGW